MIELGPFPTRRTLPEAFVVKDFWQIPLQFEILICLTSRPSRLQSLRHEFASRASLLLFFGLFFRRVLQRVFSGTLLADVNHPTGIPAKPAATETTTPQPLRTQPQMPA